MRRCFFIFLLCLAFPSLVEAQSAGLGYSVDVAEVVGNGDSLNVSLSVVFDGPLADDEAYVVRAVLRGGDSYVSVRPFGVYGRKAMMSQEYASGNPCEERVYYFGGPLSVEVDDSFLYEEWMDSLDLCVSVYHWSTDGGLLLHSSRAPYSLRRPDRPASPVFSWTPMIPEEEKESVRTVSFSMPVMFAEGSSRFEASQADNMEALGVFIDKLKCFLGMKNVRVTSSSLSVFLSPEGDLSKMDKRTLACAQSVYSELQKSVSFRSGAPRRVAGGVDWDGIGYFLEKGGFSQDVRIKEILSWEVSDEMKASSLSREKPGAWEELQLRCFPHLGKVVYSATYESRSFDSASVAKDVFDRAPEVLTAYDYYFVSELYASGPNRLGEDWTLVMCMGADQYPECIELNINAAAGCILNGNARSAVPYLRNMGDSPEALYVYAWWLYYMGRHDEAYDYFCKVMGAGGGYASVASALRPYFRWYFNLTDWERRVR